MKKLLLLSIASLGLVPALAQKKSNGIVSMEHPAITLVDEFLTATGSGDPEKIASYLSDDFKFYNGTSAARYDPGIRRTGFVKLALRYQLEPDYFAIEPFPGAHPDAVVYREDKDGEVWVQTWNAPEGTDKATGIKLNTAAPRLYKVCKDNKIKMIINYTKVPDAIGGAFEDGTNKTNYSHHDHIRTVRKDV